MHTLDVAKEAEADMARGIVRQGGALQYEAFDCARILDVAIDAEADLAGGREQRRLTKREGGESCGSARCSTARTTSL